jgi:hypothetical protein
MYVTKVCHKSMSQNVCHKSMSQNVCHKMYVTKCQYFAYFKNKSKIETNRMELKTRYDEVFVQR